MPTAAPSLFRPVQPRLQWVEPPPADAARVERLAADLRLPLPLCRILAQRGFDVPEAAKRFLRPRREHLHSHSALAGIEEAGERLARAVRSGEMILVHGDYDVDGVCGTALLTRALTMMGAAVTPFVPHRLEHGYDLTSPGVQAAAAAGASLIVTTDCGIVAHAAVRDAAAAGIDVIVTDHHTPGDTLPAALSVINPNRADCAYPEKGLAGAGVAYKLACAAAEVLGYPEERLAPLIEMVAIATIADLAPLTAENRAIVRWGLAVLANTPNTGLRALLASTGLAGRPEITAGHVGYVLAPRINAVGRVGTAMSAVRLLLTEDPREAEQLANLHELENRRRR
ncbi:MAG TPA: DHH family phosphoesterase, partial [Longimicrobiaceae bacterium]|nr:DHH family phosphoesterase [Longimicrobiaceae bacterium]